MGHEIALWLLRIINLCAVFWQDRKEYLKTLKGKYFNFLGHFFSVYCVWKIFMVSFLLLFCPLQVSSFRWKKKIELYSFRLSIIQNYKIEQVDFWCCAYVNNCRLLVFFVTRTFHLCWKVRSTTLHHLNFVSLIDIYYLLIRPTTCTFGFWDISTRSCSAHVHFAFQT